MIQRKPIRLGERDGDLIKWVTLVSKQDNKKVHYLIKQALVSYINNGKFVEIGRIKYNPSSSERCSEPLPINLWVKDSKTIQNWMKSLAEKQVNVSVMVREIMRKSITIINDEQEEWIPDYLDFDDYRVSLKTTISISNNEVKPTPSVNSILPPIEQEIVNKVASKETILSIPSQKEEMSIKTSNHRKASGLSGRRIKM